MRRLVGLLVVLASFALAASAQATVTSSSITTPSDPFFGFDQQQSQSVTISGTSNGTSSDQVDILCYDDNGSSSQGYQTIKSGVSVSSDGSFTTSVPLSSLEDDVCRLRAVQTGTTPASGLGAFAGPRIAVGVLYRADTSTSQLYDYDVYAPQLTAANEYESFGGCGLDNSYLFDPSYFGQTAENGFFCNDFEDNPTASNSSRAGVLVDGHPAYAPYSEDQINQYAVGFKPLTINSVTQNSSNGDLTIVETEPLVFCLGNPYPATSSNCPTFLSSGVQLKRTIDQTDDGHIAYIRDAWSSTNGAAHTVNLLLENDQYFDSTDNGTDVEYEFPGQSTFSSHPAGQTVSVPAVAPASILAQNPTVSGGGAGAITYAQVPSGAFAFGGSACLALHQQYDNCFDAPNTLSVPESGSAPIAYAYSTEWTLTAAQHDALVAQDKFKPPALKVTKPRNHSKTRSASVKVTGSASAGSGVKSVTVNRKKVKLSRGRFSFKVRLHRGKNQLVVRLTSQAGNTVRKTVTVTRTVKSAKKTKKAKKSPTFTG